MTDYRIGVDIGGTKIAAGVVAGDGTVVARARTATPRTGGDDVMAAVVRLLADLPDAPDSISGLGVGAPGVIDRRAGRVLSATDVLPGWAGTDVAGALRAATGLPVAVDNDVRAAALGESVYGAGRDHRDVLVASFGTGVGGALVHDGMLRHGPHGTTGEIAHLLAPCDGPIPCGCGRYDHLESHCCGPAIAAAYAAAADAVDPGQRGTDGGLTALPDVVRRARAGDTVAGSVLTSAAQLAGRALAGFASAIDVDCVVLTGGVAQIGTEILAPLRVAFAKSAMQALAGIPVVVGALAGDAPLIGAAVSASAAWRGAVEP